jgi:hypothetical protein
MVKREKAKRIMAEWAADLFIIGVFTEERYVFMQM